MMKAVHFGAGNIGRGFIGLLLHRAGYEVVFADVVDELVHEINTRNSYRVLTLDSQIQTESVEHVRAVRLDSNACVKEMVDASLITTAVGMGNLPSVAKIIAQALALRHRLYPNRILNVMACENGIRATTYLKQEVMRYCDAELCAWLDSMVGFADVAVDRIAPNRNGYATEPLDAVVEAYFEWDIEQPSLKESLILPDATFVTNLDPYLERKLFILNGSHVAAAYAGYQKKYETILEAMNDGQIEKIVSAVQREAICGLEYRHHLNPVELDQYAKKTKERFLNSHILDDVRRVGRDPQRKLSSNDRLVRPLMMAREITIETPGLITTIAFGFLYDNPEDASAVQIQKEISDNGITQTVSHITGILDKQIVREIADVYTRFQKNFA